MRTKATRSLLALLVLALTGALIAGCGSSSSKNAAGGDKKSNTVDRAFVAEMIAHHKMAVEMATNAKARGEHIETKDLGGRIVSDQNREIAEMTGIAKEIGVKPAPVPAGGMHGNHMDMGGPMSGDAKALGISTGEMGMSMNMSELDTAKPFDRAFVDMMIIHHAGAIRMARAELTKGSNAQLQKVAQAIVAAQTQEITQMNSWRKQWYGAASPSGGVPQT